MYMREHRGLSRLAQAKEWIVASGDCETTSSRHVQTLSKREVLNFADRLFSRAISTVSIDAPETKGDLQTASRVIRALLNAYELETGRQFHSIMVCGESPEAV